LDRVAADTCMAHLGYYSMLAFYALYQVACKRSTLLVLACVCLLSACSGDNGSTAATGEPIAPDGSVVGTMNGATAGTTDGVTSGAIDGTSAGAPDGTTAGSTDATTTSTAGAGTVDGATSGAVDGTTAGTAEGMTAGTADGATSGSVDETTTGMADGSSAGDTAGTTENAPTNAPIVRAPVDAQIRLSDTLDLDGTVTLDGASIGSPAIQWEKLTGPGFANFTDHQSASSAVRFNTIGLYELKLSATYAGLISSDTMKVVVISDIVNQAPIVNAGTDAELELDEVLNLAAQVEDDGLPNDTLDGQWSKVSGPGTVTFGELSAKSTTATFNSAGVFVLRFTSSDGALSDNDSVRVTVNAVTPVEPAGNNVDADNNWQVISTSNGSKPQGRHEAGAVAFQNQLYLMGGRGQRQVNRYNPANNRWENLGVPGMEINHFQPVVYGGKIYVVGPLDCCFPSESVVPKIQIFNPTTKTWSQGAEVPENRRRGSAGTVVYNNKIYIVGGSTNGHDAGMVNWFDEYNPANNQWKTLPSAPTKRDHFTAAIVGNKLVAAGGRQTDHPRTFANLVSNVDVYNFDTGKWTSGARIPTMRAGAMTVSYGDEVIVIGGESSQGTAALKTVEAYNVRTNKWRTLNSLRQQRHSGGAAIVGNAIHVVSGNTTTGGGNETQSHEKLNLD